MIANKSIIPLALCLCLTALASGEDSLKRADNELTAKPGPTCLICKTLVKEVVNFIKDNRTEAAIEQSLEEICQLIFKDGSPNREQCDDMVQAYTKELVKILVDESDPELICILIELCRFSDIEQARKIRPQKVNILEKEIPPVDMGPLISEFISMLDPSIQVNSMRTCVECKLFIKYLQDTFESPKSRDTLKQWLLDNLCQNLSDPETHKYCNQMVDKYSDDFFKAIAEQLEPQTVCSDLKACKKATLMEMFRQPAPSFLPSASFGGGDSPATSIVNDDDDDQNEPKSEVDLSTVERQEDVDSALCEECIEIVKKLDEYLSTNAIDNDVSQLIDMVCNRIPDDYVKDTCTQIIKTIGQEIVEMIHTMDNPRQFCHDTVEFC